MPKSRTTQVPLNTCNGYAAAVSSNSIVNTNLNSRRQNLVPSRSSGAIPLNQTGALPLAQISGPMRRYSATGYNDYRHMATAHPNAGLLPPKRQSSLNQYDESGAHDSPLSTASCSQKAVITQNGTILPSSNYSNSTLIPANFKPGMKEVPGWLKALRLHKYTALFQNMDYDEMMTLDEQQLEQKQVTKGARKKILQSVQKLKERVTLLKQLETCIDEKGDTRCLIFELRAMMNSPIWSTSMSNKDEDLPSQICRILQRLNHYFFEERSSDNCSLGSVPTSPVTGRPQAKPELISLEDEYVVKLLQTCDRVINHDAFTAVQKQFIAQFRRVLRRYAQHNQAQQPYQMQQSRSYSQFNVIPQMFGARNSQPNMMSQQLQNVVPRTSFLQHQHHHHSLIDHNNASGGNTNVFIQQKQPITALGAAGRFGVLESVDATSSYQKPVSTKPSVPQASQTWTQQIPDQPAKEACSTAQQAFANTNAQHGSSDLNGQHEPNASNMAENAMNYPQLLLGMLSTIPEFRQILERGITSDLNGMPMMGKPTYQTASTQTVATSSKEADRPLTAQEKLQFVNEFLPRYSNQDAQVNAQNGKSWANAEGLADRLASQLVLQCQNPNQALNSNTNDTGFQMLNSNIGNSSPRDSTSFLGQWTPVNVKESFALQPKYETKISPKETVFSGPSSGYSSSNCSEPDRSSLCGSPPGLMVYDFGASDRNSGASDLCSQTFGPALANTIIRPAALFDCTKNQTNNLVSNPNAYQTSKSYESQLLTKSTNSQPNPYEQVNIIVSDSTPNFQWMEPISNKHSVTPYLRANEQYADPFCTYDPSCPPPSSYYLPSSFANSGNVTSSNPGNQSRLWAFTPEPRAVH
ncbi:SAM domain (Sterile alpha motif) domain-containing protein [Ditylenchus destructor]|nr:SAM domain (Sterile alpha motif) domain-containing protein [Ditylenchus destructor]